MIQSDAFEDYYRKEKRKEDQMELHEEVTSKDIRKLADDWKEVGLPAEL